MNDALCVCELADILDMPQSSVSSHVQIIRKAGLFESERCGKWNYFRVQPKARKAIEQLLHFHGDPSNPVWEADAKRAIARLRERENSCCTGPKLLATKTKPKLSNQP